MEEVALCPVVSSNIVCKQIKESLLKHNGKAEAATPNNLKWVNKEDRHNVNKELKMLYSIRHRIFYRITNIYCVKEQSITHCKTLDKCLLSFRYQHLLEQKLYKYTENIWGI